MIKNEKEYAAAKARRSSFEHALADFDVVSEIEAGVDPTIARAQRDSFAHHLDRIEAEIRRYETLQSGNSDALVLSAINDLGHCLIQARVVKGWTQKALAERVGLKEQQIQRYEKDLYKTANLKRLSLIAQGLSLKFEGSIEVESEESTGPQFLFGIPIGEFPYNEAAKKGWLARGPSGKRVSSEEKQSAILRYFAEAPAMAGEVLHRKSDGPMVAQRRAAILMWQAKVLMQAELKAHRFPPFVPLSSDAISQLVKFSALTDGPLRAIELLERHGIIVVFEDYLARTKLDGAALAIGHRQAVIAMSLRHDRLDNFWFVLLHELGHLMRHWRKVSQFGIIDEDVGSESTELFEREADEFARTAIVPDETWKNSLVRYASDPDSVVKFAARVDVHPALIAGKIRFERGYNLFSTLIGHGEVKKMMSEAGRWSPTDELV